MELETETLAPEVTPMLCVCCPSTQLHPGPCDNGSEAGPVRAPTPSNRDVGGVRGLPQHVALLRKGGFSETMK